jgi:hypothetical protein
MVTSKYVRGGVTEMRLPSALDDGGAPLRHGACRRDINAAGDA